MAPVAGLDVFEDDAAGVDAAEARRRQMEEDAKGLDFSYDGEGHIVSDGTEEPTEE